jgi:hypothetical protein
MIAKRVLLSVLFTFMFGSIAPAHSQENKGNILSEVDKAEIVESVLRSETKGQNFGSGVLSFPQLSSENIEFVEPSRVSAQGFVLISSQRIRELAKNQLVEYVLLRTISAKDGKAVVILSHVTEGRACFGTVSGQRSFAYEFHKTLGKWTGEMVGQLLPSSFASPARAKAFTGRSLKMALDSIGHP